MADDQIKFSLIIDKNTGAVKQVASDLEDVKAKAEKVGSTSKEASAKGEDGFKKLGGKVTEFAMGMLVAQLALEGLKKIASQNDAFQELQTTFNDTAKVLIDVFQPAITMISKGLSGLVTIIGGLGQAAKKMLSGDWSGAMDVMATSVERAAGIIEGTVKVITKNMMEAATTRLEQEQAHAAAVSSLHIADADRRLQQLHLTEDQKLTIMAEKHQAELQLIDQQASAKKALLNLQLEGSVITQQQFEQKMAAIEQQSSDAKKAIKLKSKTELEAVERDRVAKLEGFFKQEIMAGKNAAVARYEQSHSVSEAVRAGAGAQVSALADYAGEYIMIEGAKAAATAFVSASAVGGPVAGALAAAGTLLFFTGLAATVGVAGHAVAGAIAGPSAGGAGGGGGGVSESGNSVGAAGGEAGGGVSAVGVSSGGAPGSVQGGGAPGGGVTVLVYLDGDVLFRAITNASRDGRVVITSRNVVP